MKFIITIQICVIMPLFLVIAYYTSKINSIKNAKKYQGHYIEIFAKRFNKDILPIFNFDIEEQTTLKMLQKRRNMIIFFWWLNFISLISTAIFHDYYLE